MTMNRRNQIEDRINYLTAEIAERERIIRAAQEAEKELIRLRSELKLLMAEYLEISEVSSPLVIRLKGGAM
jgi:archaellum component FlaC